MLSPSDQHRARFAPNDPVSFQSRKKTLKGKLIRANPKCGIVLVNEQEYTVPYELLFPETKTATLHEKHITAVMKLGMVLIAKHGLKKWQFKFDHSTRRAGCCNYRDKTISIAFDLAHSGKHEDIHDTILHEIAHALVGKKHNHDTVWKAKAKEIGCSGERTHKLQFSPPRWNVTCENRCWSHTAQQRNSKLICRTCGSKLVYTPCSSTI